LEQTTDTEPINSGDKIASNDVTMENNEESEEKMVEV